MYSVKTASLEETSGRPGTGASAALEMRQWCVSVGPKTRRFLWTIKIGTSWRVNGHVTDLLLSRSRCSIAPLTGTGIGRM